MAGSKKAKNKIKSKDHVLNSQPISAFQDTDKQIAEDDEMYNQILFQLHEKIEDAVKQAFSTLMRMFYGYPNAEKALVRGSLIIGEDSMVNNLVRSSISYLESHTKVNNDVYLTDESIPSSANQLPYAAQAFINGLASMAIMHYPPHTDKIDVIRDMLHCKLVASHVIGSAHQDASPGLGEADENRFDIFLRNHTDEILECRFDMSGGKSEFNSSTAMVKKKNLQSMASIVSAEWLGKYSTIQEWFENSPDEEDEKAAKLQNLVSHLEAQVKEKQDWAEKKEREMAEREGKHSLMLTSLRQENTAVALNQLRKEKKRLESAQISKMMATDSETVRMFGQLGSMTNKIGELQQDSSDLRADISVWKEDIAHLKKQLKQANKKEKKDLQKIEAYELEMRKLEEMKLENSKIRQRLRDAEEAKKKLQLRLKMEKEAKDRANQLCLEEKRLLKMEEEIEQQRLAALQTEPEFQNEDLRRVKEFADHQMMPYPMLASGSGGYESSREVGISSYWKRCVKCNRKEACVLFMPCYHSVVCWDCNAMVQDCCPLCERQVQHKIAIREDHSA